MNFRAEMTSIELDLPNRQADQIDYAPSSPSLLANLPDDVDDVST